VAKAAWKLGGKGARWGWGKAKKFACWVRGGKAAKGGLRIADGQFGKKLGKHAADFGLDPSNPPHREAFRGIIEGIASLPDKVVSGTFRGQGAVDFLIKGSDVVVSKGGDFVTILKGGVSNPSVLKALGQ
jgi:filamentous hemagglutinin